MNSCKNWEFPSIHLRTEVTFQRILSIVLCVKSSLTSETVHQTKAWWRHDVKILYLLFYANPSVTTGFPSRKACNVDHSCVICGQPQQVVEHKVELCAIWDAITLIWRHCDTRCALGSTEPPKLNGVHVIGDRTHVGHVGSPWTAKVH